MSDTVFGVAAITRHQSCGSFDDSGFLLHATTSFPARMNDDDRRAVTGVSGRRAALLQDLRTRLGPVCQGWPDELFSSMIQELADITLRYDGHASASTYDTRTPDKLVANLKAVLGREGEKDNPEDRSAE